MARRDERIRFVRADAEMPAANVQAKEVKHGPTTSGFLRTFSPPAGCGLAGVGAPAPVGVRDIADGRGVCAWQYCARDDDNCRARVTADRAQGASESRAASYAHSFGLVVPVWCAVRSARRATCAQVARSSGGGGGNGASAHCSALDWTCFWLQSERRAGERLLRRSTADTLAYCLAQVAPVA